MERWNIGLNMSALKVFQDEKGRAVQMNFAVIDTIKWNDLPNDKHSSKKYKYSSE